MLRGQSDAQIAHQLGINRGTIFRWRTKLKPFAIELERLRRGMYNRAVDRLYSLLDPAIKILENQLSHPSVASDPKIALRIVQLALAQKLDRPTRDVFKRDPYAEAGEAYFNMVLRKRQDQEDAAALSASAASAAGPPAPDAPPR